MTTLEKYTVREFYEIKEKINVDDYISQETVEYISSLTEKVGAPSYSKTPIFNNKNKPRKEKTKSRIERYRLGSNTAISNNRFSIRN